MAPSESQTRGQLEAYPSPDAPNGAHANLSEAQRPAARQHMLACVRAGKAAKGHKIYPYLVHGLRIERPNQVWCALLETFAAQCTAGNAWRQATSRGLLAKERRKINPISWSKEQLKYRQILCDI